MSREYARIMTRIWRNAEFRALSETEQRAYLLLVTQSDISAAGVLAVRLRRWADMSCTSTPEALAQVFKALSVGRFIVVDWDTEELLVRSFVRWDGGFNNPKRRPVIMRAAGEVESASIFKHLAIEFERCGLTLPPGSHPDRPSDSHPDSLSGSDSKIDTSEPRSAPSPQVNRLSDRVSPSDGVVVTYVTEDNTTTPNPKNTTPPASAPNAQTITGAWLDGCRERPPKAVIGHTSKVIKGLLDEGIDPAAVEAGVESWAAKGLHPSALPSVVNEHLNARPAAASRSREPSRAQQWLALGQPETDVIDVEPHEPRRGTR